MAKEQDAQSREKQIQANSKKAVDEAKRQLGIPQKKKSREDFNQAGFRIVSKATEKK
jgi:hypothetical protein